MTPTYMPPIDPLGPILALTGLYVLVRVVLRRLTSPLQRVVGAVGRVRDRSLPPILTAALLIVSSATTLSQLAAEGLNAPADSLLYGGAGLLVLASAALAVAPKTVEALLAVLALIAGYQQLAVALGHPTAIRQFAVAAPAIGLFMLLKWARNGGWG